MSGIALLTGATGYTGTRLLPHLRSRHDGVRALVRRADAVVPEWVTVEQADLSVECPTHHFRDVSIVYHLAHVALSANLLAQIPPSVERVVVVSSLRALSKVDCPTVAQVLAGERAVHQCAVPWTILRPSMIFGDGDDRNLSRIAARIRQGAPIPVIGASYRHQPVFVDNVIEVILAAAERPAQGQTFAVAGAAALSWGDLLQTMGDVLDRSPRLIRVPGGLVAFILRIAEALRFPTPVTSAQVRRLMEDKVYDIGPAQQELGFSPLSFAEAFGQIHAGASC